MADFLPNIQLIFRKTHVKLQSFILSSPSIAPVLIQIETLNPKYSLNYITAWLENIITYSTLMKVLKLMTIIWQNVFT